jgi:hypothetical protein
LNLLVFGTFDRLLIQLTSLATSHAMMKLQAKPVKQMETVVFPSNCAFRNETFLESGQTEPTLGLDFVQVKRSTTGSHFKHFTHHKFHR